jgi:hypothetical protein
MTKLNAAQGPSMKARTKRKAPMPRTTRPTMEWLEDRSVPATFGLPWIDGYTTLSFAGDGTEISDRTSDLNAVMSAQYGSGWKLEVLKAFQTWAVQTNLNVGLVGDGGQAFGSPGAAQADSRYGDIRIGGTALASDVLAVTAPPDLLGSTWAGDVVLNTLQQFLRGGTGGSTGYDLFTAMLHEAGHSFGMENSSASTSAMSNFQGVRTGLSTADVAGIRGLYGGAREKDAYEGSLGNETLARATQMQRANIDGDLLNSVYAVLGDVQNTGDVDFYKFKAGLLGQVSVNLRTQGISLFVGTVSVYDKYGKLIASATANGPLDNDVTLKFSTSLLRGDEYFVSVKSARSDVFGVGGYGLVVDTSPLTTPLTTGLIDGVLSELKVAGGRVGALLAPSNATVTLDEKTTTVDGSTRVYDAVGYLDALHAKQTFQVTSLDTTATQTLVATVRAIDRSVVPQIKVLDGAGNVVAATVLTNQDGTYTVSAKGVAANATYFVQVASTKPMLTQGAFHLAAVFTTNSIQAPTNLDSGTLGGAGPTTDSSMLSVTQSQVAHFVLSATTPDGSNATSPVTMTIRDKYGNVIFTLTAKPGETVTGDVRLPIGDYSITYAVDPPKNGGAVAATQFKLEFWTVTDPIGPRPTSASGGDSYGGNTGSGSTSTSTTLAMR